MLDPKVVRQKAKTSPFYKWLLNWSLARMIPFNKPHGFQVVDLDTHRVKISIPYRKSNFNHIRGLHACALATISEYATGFVLVANLDSKKYRLIMQRLEMNYHYQGKMDAFAEFEISEQWLQEKVYEPLKSEDAVVQICEIKIHDIKGNHLTTGHVHWQIKDWNKVRTKA